MKSKLKKVLAIQDDCCDWFVIPIELRDEFYKDNYNESMTDCGEFDDKWGKYRTGGDLNLIQLWAEI